MSEEGEIFMTDAEKKLLQAKHRLEEAQARDRVKEIATRLKGLLDENGRTYHGEIIYIP